MITPDTKDWTWVIEQPCPDCGYDAAALDPRSVGSAVRATLPRWTAVLDRPGVEQRPAPDVWSPLEYGCHVRDVFELFAERLNLMLSQDDPRFANWDQDETAVVSRYGEQDPEIVSADLESAGAAIADAFDAVRDDQWDRTAERSDGARFTTERFARYFLHDVVHHLHDVDG